MRRKEDINRAIKKLTYKQYSLNNKLDWMENLEQASTKKLESSNNLILALAIGIVGNFFAQFSYSLFDSFSNSNYNLFYLSIAGFTVTLFILLYVINYYFKQKKREQKYLDSNLAKDQSALKVRLANIPFEIENLKKELETEEELKNPKQN